MMALKKRVDAYSSRQATTEKPPRKRVMDRRGGEGGQTEATRSEAVMRRKSRNPFSTTTTKSGREEKAMRMKEVEMEEEKAKLKLAREWFCVPALLVFCYVAVWGWYLQRQRE